MCTLSRRAKAAICPGPYANGPWWVTVLLAGLWADELLRVDVGDAVRFTAIGVDKQRARGALVHWRWHTIRTM